MLACFPAFCPLCPGFFPFTGVYTWMLFLKALGSSWSNFSPTSPVLGDPLQLLPAQPLLHEVCLKVMSLVRCYFVSFSCPEGSCPGLSPNVAVWLFVLRLATNIFRVSFVDYTQRYVTFVVFYFFDNFSYRFVTIAGYTLPLPTPVICVTLCVHRLSRHFDTQTTQDLIRTSFKYCST